MFLCLQAAILKLQPGSVISLKEGVAWLGNPSNATNDLFVRGLYPEMLRARAAHFHAPGLLISSSETVFTGSPGRCNVACF